MGYDFTAVVINGHKVYGHAFWDDNIIDEAERQYKASLHLVYGAYETDNVDLAVRDAILFDRRTYVGERDYVSHFHLPFAVEVVLNEDGDDKLIQAPVRLYLVSVDGITVKQAIFSTKAKAAAEVERLTKLTSNAVSIVALKLDWEIE